MKSYREGVCLQASAGKVCSVPGAGCTAAGPGGRRGGTGGGDGGYPYTR